MLRVYPLWMGISYAYLVDLNDGVALVDAGLPGREAHVLGKLRALGSPPLMCIYLTHAHLDHAGSAAALHRATGAPVLVHQADAPDLRQGHTDLGRPRGIGQLVKPVLPLIEHFFVRPVPCEPDMIVNDGDRLDRFGLAAQVVHTPGHTPGSTTLLFDSGQAFVGDLLTTHGPFPRLQRRYATNWSALRPSLERLQAAAPKYIYAGHGDYIPVLGESLAWV